MLTKINYSSIISVIVILSLLSNWASPAFSFTQSLPKVFQTDPSDLGQAQIEAPFMFDILVYAAIIVGIIIIVDVWSRVFAPPEKPPPPPRTYDLKTERKFLRYETYDTDEIISTSFKIGIKDKLLEEGRCSLFLHLGKIENVRVYGKEIWSERLFRVYHDDGSVKFIRKKEVEGDTIPVGEKQKTVSSAPNAQIEITTDIDFTKAGMVLKTDEYGNMQVPLYSVRPFLEIEGTRTKDYGLTTKTLFLRKERFRDYQIVSVNFTYEDTSAREKISCYSLERSVKELIDSAINTKIISVRFIVEDIDSHTPIDNPTIKVEGVPPAAEELLTPYFTSEYKGYATRFVKGYLRGIYEMVNYETVELYHPFSYTIEVTHPKYHFWKKKVYIDGSKDEYIIRMSELGTKIKGEITTR